MPTAPNPNQALARIAEDLQEGRAEKALDRVRQLLQNVSTKQEALAACALEAQALVALGRGEEGLAALDRGLEEAASAGLGQYVDALHLLRDQLEPRVERARLVAMPLEAIEAASCDPAERSVTLIQKAVAHADSDDLVTARVLLPLARAAAGDNPRALVSVLIGTVYIQATAGDLAAARNTHAEAVALAREHEPDALPVLDDLESGLGSPA